MLKFQEGFILPQLTDYASKKLNKTQYGFAKGISIDNAKMRVIKELHDAKNTSTNAYALTFDLEYTLESSTVLFTCSYSEYGQFSTRTELQFSPFSNSVLLQCGQGKQFSPFIAVQYCTVFFSVQYWIVHIAIQYFFLIFKEKCFLIMKTLIFFTFLNKFNWNYTLSLAEN